MGNAKNIPANPDAIFLPYQGAWIADEARLKLMEKSRQIGISWSTAYAAVSRTGRQGARHDQWVSSRDDIQARLFLEDCKLFTGVLHMAARDLGEQVIDEKTRQTAYVLSFLTGKRINSMSSNPDARRASAAAASWTSSRCTRIRASCGRSHTRGSPGAVRWN